MFQNTTRSLNAVWSGEDQKGAMFRSLEVGRDVVAEPRLKTRDEAVLLGIFGAAF